MAKATITSMVYNEEALFSMLQNDAMAKLSEFLTEYYGERCPDFEPDCECCKRWAAFDVIFGK